VPNRDSKRRKRERILLNKKLNSNGRTAKQVARIKDKRSDS